MLLIMTQTFFKYLLLFTAVIFFNFAKAQSYLGLHTSNFDPLKNVYYNPAILSGSDLRWQLNILSFDINAANNYIKIKSPLRGIVKDFDRTVYFPEILNGDTKKLSTSIDVQGPSFLMQFGKNAFAVTSRSRVIVSANDLTEGLASSLYNHGKQLLEYRPFFNDQRVTAAANAYTELGFAYSREIFDKGGHRLRIGVHAKLLSPAFYASFKGDNINYNRNLTQFGDSTVNLGNTQFDLRVSSNLEKNADGKAQYGYPLAINGFAADFGVEYELRVTRLMNYFIRAGISVNDIGGMGYQYGNYSRTFVANGQNVPAQSLLGSDGLLRSWDEVLDSLGTQTKTSGNFRVQLPTVLNTYVDVCVVPKFYILASAQFNPYTFKRGDAKANLPTVVTLVPRFETKKISAFAPMSWDQYGGFNLGAGARFGLIAFGTSNLVSSFMKKDFTGIDFYLSVSVGGKKRINK
jgi:hypothetical protein